MNGEQQQIEAHLTDLEQRAGEQQVWIERLEKAIDSLWDDDSDEALAQ